MDIRYEGASDICHEDHWNDAGQQDFEKSAEVQGDRRHVIRFEKGYDEQPTSDGNPWWLCFSIEVRGCYDQGEE